MLIISQLILCSLCFNSVLTKKIHSSASRAVQPSRSQYDQRYRRKRLWRPQPRSWRTPRSNPGFEHFSTWSKFVLDLYLRSQLVVLLHDVVHVVLRNIGSLVWLLCSDIRYSTILLLPFWGFKFWSIYFCEYFRHEPVSSTDQKVYLMFSICAPKFFLVFSQRCNRVCFVLQGFRFRYSHLH